MNSVLISLGEDGLLELHAVLLDNDPVAALEFLKRHIAPKIPRKGTAPCDSSRLNPFILPRAAADEGGVSLPPTRTQQPDAGATGRPR
jgi:hypothetical protein